MREYANKQLVLMGLKQPESEEEQQALMQAQQQQGQPDAAMVQAQGVLLQGQADLKKAQNDEARIQVDALEAQTDAQVSAAKVVEILASADSTKKQDLLAALKLLGDFQHRQGDSARADAELVLKGQDLIHSHRKEITSLMRQTNLPTGGVAETPQ